MGKKLDAFLDGIASIFNIIPQSTYSKNNYIKHALIKDFSNLNLDKNCIAKNMQKVLTQDLGNALNEMKENLSVEDLEGFERISRLHKQAEKHYSNVDSKT